MYAGPGRQSRRASPRGTRSRQRRRWEIEENFPVWSGALATARRRACSTARWTAGSRPSMRRRGKLLWQFKTRLRDHRPAGVAIAAPTASSTSRCSPASAAGPARWWRATSTRATAPRARRLRQRDEGPARRRRTRAACSMCSRCRGGSAMMTRLRASPAAALRRGVAAQRAALAQRSALRVCADPDNLPYSHATAAASRTASRSCSPTT